MHSQDYPWSCGAAAVRNALEAVGVVVSEQDVRREARTVSESECPGCAATVLRKGGYVAPPDVEHTCGTPEEGIIAALEAFDCGCDEIRTDDFDEAEEELHQALQEGSPVILCVDNWEHWVVAVGSLGQTGVAVFDCSNFKVNRMNSATYVWDSETLERKWRNSRKHVEEERMYGVIVTYQGE